MAFGEGGGHYGLGTSQVRARPVQAAGPCRGSPTPRKAAARAEGQCPLLGLTLFLTPAPSPDPLPMTSSVTQGKALLPTSYALVPISSDGTHLLYL